MAAEAALEVCRLSGTRDKLRRYAVVIDGDTDEHGIAEGDCQSVQLSAGIHTVQVRLGRRASPILQTAISEKEPSRIFCCSGSLTRIDIDLMSRRSAYLQIGTGQQKEELLRRAAIARPDLLRILSIAGAFILCCALEGAFDVQFPYAIVLPVAWVLGVWLVGLWLSKKPS